MLAGKAFIECYNPVAGTVGYTSKGTKPIGHCSSEQTEDS